MFGANIVDWLPVAWGEAMILVKMIYVLGLLIYLVFAAVVIKQVRMMERSLNGRIKLPLEPVAWVHLMVVVGLLVVTMVML